MRGGDVAAPGPASSRVIISAVSWGLACFPAVSGTGKGRQYRDVIREGGGVPVEIPSPGRKTMCVALPNWERVVLGVGGEGRGSEPKRLCLGLRVRPGLSRHPEPLPASG